MFPAVAEIMRCPREIFSAGGVTLGVGTAPVDAVDVIGKGSSNLDVHGVESTSDSKTAPEALEWREVAEISSPVDIQSATTDCYCVETRLVSRLLGKKSSREAVRHQIEDFRGFAGGGGRR
jgi:hypothetical protein